MKNTNNIKKITTSQFAKNFLFKNQKPCFLGKESEPLSQSTSHSSNEEKTLKKVLFFFLNTLKDSKNNSLIRIIQRF